MRISSSPLTTRGQLARGSRAKSEATARARIQPSAGRSTGVLTQRAGPRSCQTRMVSAAQRTRAIDIGATVQGSVATRMRRESADALTSASGMAQDFGVRPHGQLRRALPREPARARQAAADQLLP